jgi:hypothetical protein
MFLPGTRSNRFDSSMTASAKVFRAAKFYSLRVLQTCPTWSKRQRCTKSQRSQSEAKSAKERGQSGPSRFLAAVMARPSLRPAQHREAA